MSISGYDDGSGGLGYTGPPPPDEGGGTLSFDGGATSQNYAGGDNAGDTSQNTTDYGGSLGYAGPPAPTEDRQPSYDQPQQDAGADYTPLGNPGVPNVSDYNDTYTPPEYKNRGEQSVPNTGETVDESKQITDATYPIYETQDKVKQEYQNEGASLDGEWNDLKQRIDDYKNGEQPDPQMEGSLTGELDDLQKRYLDWQNRPDSFYNDRFAGMDDNLRGTLKSVGNRITDTQATDQSNFDQALGYAGAPKADWSRAGALGLDLLSQTNPSLTGAPEDSSNLNQARGGVGYQPNIPLPDPNNQDDLQKAFQQQYPNSGATAALYNPDGTPNDLAGEYLNRTATQMQDARQQWLADNPTQLPSAFSPLERKILIDNPIAQRYSPFNGKLIDGVVPESFVNLLDFPLVGGGLAAGGAKFAGKKAAQDYLLQGAHNDITNTIGAITGFNPGDLVPSNSVAANPGGAIADAFMAIKNDPVGATTRLRDYITSQPNPGQIASDIGDQLFNQDPTTAARQKGLQGLISQVDPLVGQSGRIQVAAVLLNTLVADTQAQTQGYHNLDPTQTFQQYLNAGQQAIQQGTPPQQAYTDAFTKVSQGWAEFFWNMNPRNPAYQAVQLPALEEFIANKVLNYGQRGTQAFGRFLQEQASTLPAGSWVGNLSREAGVRLISDPLKRGVQGAIPYAGSDPAASKGALDTLGQIISSRLTGGAGYSGGLLDQGGTTQTARLMDDFMARYGNVVPQMPNRAGLRTVIDLIVDGARSVNAQLTTPLTDEALGTAIASRLDGYMNPANLKGTIAQQVADGLARTARELPGVTGAEAQRLAAIRDLNSYLVEGVRAHAGMPPTTDPNLAQRVLSGFRTSLLVPAAIGLSVRKVFDEALRSSVVGAYGLNPADLNLIQRVAGRMAQSDHLFPSILGRNILDNGAIGRSITERLPISTRIQSPGQNFGPGRQFVQNTVGATTTHAARNVYQTGIDNGLAAERSAHYLDLTNTLRQAGLPPEEVARAAFANGPAEYYQYAQEAQRLRDMAASGTGVFPARAPGPVVDTARTPAQTLLDRMLGRTLGIHAWPSELGNTFAPKAMADVPAFVDAVQRIASTKNGASEDFLNAVRQNLHVQQRANPAAAEALAQMDAAGLRASRPASLEQLAAKYPPLSDEEMVNDAARQAAARPSSGDPALDAFARAARDIPVSGQRLGASSFYGDRNALAPNYPNPAAYREIVQRMPQDAVDAIKARGADPEQLLQHYHAAELIRRPSEGAPLYHYTSTRLDTPDFARNVAKRNYVFLAHDPELAARGPGTLTAEQGNRRVYEVAHNGVKVVGQDAPLHPLSPDEESRYINDLTTRFTTAKGRIGTGDGDPYSVATGHAQTAQRALEDLYEAYMPNAQGIVNARAFVVPYAKMENAGYRTAIDALGFNAVPVLDEAGHTIAVSDLSRVSPGQRILDIRDGKAVPTGAPIGHAGEPLDNPLARQAAARQQMGANFDPGGFATPGEHLAPGTDVGASLRPFEGQGRFVGNAGAETLGVPGMPAGIENWTPTHPQPERPVKPGAAERNALAGEMRTIQQAATGQRALYEGAAGRTDEPFVRHPGATPTEIPAGAPLGNAGLPPGPNSHAIPGEFGGTMYPPGARQGPPPPASALNRFGQYGGGPNVPVQGVKPILGPPSFWGGVPSPAAHGPAAPFLSPDTLNNAAGIYEQFGRERQIANFNRTTDANHLINRAIGELGAHTALGQTMADWVYPFLDFHMNATAINALNYARMPLYPITAMAYLNSVAQSPNYLQNTLGQIPVAGHFVGPLNKLSTGASDLAYLRQYGQYIGDTRKSDNNPLQQAVKIAAHPLVGNEPFIAAPFDWINTPATAAVQKATNPNLDDKGNPTFQDRMSAGEAYGGTTGLLRAGVDQLPNSIPDNVRNTLRDKVAPALGNPGAVVGNALRDQAMVPLLDKLPGNDLAIKDKNHLAELPYRAPELAGDLGWNPADKNRIAFAVADITRTNGQPMGQDGKELLRQLQYKQDLEQGAGTFPVPLSDVTNVQDKTTAIYPADSSTPFFYQRNAGEGGKDAGVDVATKSGGTFLEPHGQAQANTARDQLDLPVSTSTVPTMDYARDYLTNTVPNLSAPRGGTESQAIAARNDRQQASQDKFIAGNAKYTGAGLPQDQRLQKIADDQILQSSAGPNGFTGQDLINQDGNYYSTLDKIKAANDAGNKNEAARLRGELTKIIAADVAQDPALAKLFDEYKAKGAATAAANSPEAQTYATWEQPKRDAYDAFNDLRNSADYKRYTQLLDEESKAGPFGSAQEKAWYTANKDELGRLKGIVTAAEQAIITKTGYNPKQVANEMQQAVGKAPTYANTDVATSTASSSTASGSKSSSGAKGTSSTAGRSSTKPTSSRSASTGRSYGAGGSAASTQKAGDDFFTAYRDLTPTEKRLARNDKAVADVLVSGVKHSEQQYTVALEHLKTTVGKANGSLSSANTTGNTTGNTTQNAPSKANAYGFHAAPTNFHGVGPGLTPDQLARGVDSIGLDGREQVIQGFAARAQGQREASGASNLSGNATQTSTPRSVAYSAPLGYSGVPTTKTPKASTYTSPNTYTSNYGKTKNAKGR